MRFYAASLDGIQIGCAAPIRTVPGKLLQVSTMLQVCQRSLDRGAGQLHVGRYGLDAGPAFALGI